MNKQTFEYKLNEILIFFDFNRVERAMVALDWCWGGEEDSPTKYEMIKTVRSLGQNFITKTDMVTEQTVSTGGFELIVKDNDVSLKFVVESCEANDLYDNVNKLE